MTGPWGWEPVGCVDTPQPTQPTQPTQRIAWAACLLSSLMHEAHGTHCEGIWGGLDASTSAPPAYLQFHCSD